MLKRIITCGGIILSCASTTLAWSDSTSGDPSDPLESLNRRIFTFNVFSDKWLLKPIATLYHHLPKPVGTSVSNFFGNLQEPANVLNDVLQWKWRAAGRDTGRFVVNTTAGIGGLLDVANYLGWKNTGGEDFGQTLRTWGLPAGPYLMVPFLGPSTVTDLVAYPVDLASNPVTYVTPKETSYEITALNIVNKRANLFAAEELLPTDSDPKIERDKRYVAVRSAYLQNRIFKTQDGKVKDDFGDDTAFEDLDSQK